MGKQKRALSKRDRDRALRLIAGYPGPRHEPDMMTALVPNVHADRLTHSRGQLWIVERQLENVRVTAELGMLICVDDQLLELASRHVGLSDDGSAFVYWWLHPVNIPDHPEGS